MKKKLTYASVALLAAVVLGAGIVHATRSMPAKDVGRTPTTRVERGSVDATVHTTGELRTPHSAMIVAPPIWGTLQLIHMAQNGQHVKSGETIIEFDPSEQEYNLEQNRSQLQEAEQLIIKAKADAAVQAAQDKVAVLKARFNVRRAELEVQKNELVGEIDARKNVLALNEAKRRAAQVEQDVTARRQSSNAGIAVLEQRKMQAKLQMDQAQHNIDIMKITAPIDGVMSIKENQDAAGGFYYPGMVLPLFREGDQVSPGRTVAEVLDLTQLEIAASVSERDRPHVNPGAPVEVKVDAAPEAQYTGKVKSVAALASRSPWSNNAVQSFDATFEIANPDARLRPGATARITVQGDLLKNVLFVPRECLFQKDGKPVIYVRDRAGFRAEAVKVVRETESSIVIDGVAEGTEIALLDPTAPTPGASNEPSGDRKSTNVGVGQ